eukprot:1147086-Pelagomonas_calceolata.AAC.1
MRVERRLLKSTSGANEFKSVWDRMSLKLQSKLDSLRPPTTTSSHCNNSALKCSWCFKLPEHI